MISYNNQDILPSPSELTKPSEINYDNLTFSEKNTLPIGASFVIMSNIMVIHYIYNSLNLPHLVLINNIMKMNQQNKKV